MRQTINFNEINISNRHVYYPANTCVRIALISFLIDGFFRTNCQPWVYLKGVEETPLLRLCNDSTTALISPSYSRPYNRPYERLYIVSTNGSALSLRTALRTALQRLCNGPMNGSTYLAGASFLNNKLPKGLNTL